MRQPWSSFTPTASRRCLFATRSFGVHFDPALRNEVVSRVDALNLPSYTAFVMPRLEARCGDDGEIVDVDISYPCNLEAQMLEYSAFARQECHSREGELASRGPQS
jgi:hypothetical protein